MNNGYNEIGISAILLLSVALLFSNVQQGYGSSELSPELNEKSITELYKLEQLVKVEQTRDKIFASTAQENPYLNTSLNVVVPFEENDEEKSLKVDRRSELFQLIKDEQISNAEKKFNEILGGKTILNSINDELIDKNPILSFKIDNQTGHMNRDSNDFQNYMSLEISKAKIFRDNNWKEFGLGANPYQNNESNPLDVTSASSTLSSAVLPPGFSSNQVLTFRYDFDNLEIKVKVQTEKVQQILDAVSTMNISLVNQVIETNDIGVISPSKAIKRIFAMNMLSDNEENQILSLPLKQQNEENQILNISSKRENPEFNNLVIKQISLAENMRNEMAEFGTSDYSNPYLNENTDESLDKTNKNNPTTNWKDLDFVTNELELTRMDRGTEEFEMAKATELEIAQNMLNKMSFLTNSDVEITSQSNDKINNFIHGDLDLKTIKNNQIELAEKKLFELYGYQISSDLDK